MTANTLRYYGLKALKIIAGLCLLIIMLTFALITFFMISWHLSKTTVSAELEDSIKVSMTLKPAFMTYAIGLHSDYHRDLRVNTKSRTKSKSLFMDTGWWRGSQLYRAKDGSVILHEGQNGCLLLVTAEGAPSITSIDCTERLADSIDPSCTAPSAKPQPSFQFSGWTYLGRFYEVGYDDYTKTGECLLPDAL